MDILILVVSLLSLTVAAICLLMLMRMRSGIQEADNTDGYDKKLDELREAIYNEFARNRSEQNQSALAQRQEMTNKISAPTVPEKIPSDENGTFTALVKIDTDEYRKLFYPQPPKKAHELWYSPKTKKYFTVLTDDDEEVKPIAEKWTREVSGVK